jgi:transcriptional regulator with XRE-family HTH domain
MREVSLNIRGDESLRLKKIRDILGFSQREMADELGVVHGNIKRMNVPTEWILVNHMHWGIYSIMAHLKAKVRFRNVLDELL